MAETQPVTPELLPCPNPFGCDGRPVLDRSDLPFSVEIERAFVFCDQCGIEGPTRPTEAEAITAWNTRTSPRGTDREAVLREALEEITRRCELALEPLPVASPFARDLRQIMGMVAALNPKEKAS